MSNYKFIHKKVTTTQKINACCCKQHLKKCCHIYANSICILLSCTHSAIYVVQSLQLLFIFHSFSFSWLQALEECKPHLSQNSTGKNQGRGGGGIIRYRDAAAQEVDSPKLTAANRTAFQECHLTVDVLWCLIMLKNNNWFVFKKLKH